MEFLASDAPLLVIIGPSGVGKSTLVRELVANGLLVVTPSWTTREMRADEDQSNIEHVFCDDETFDKMLSEHRFLDVARPFKDSSRYALARIVSPPVGQIPTVLLRAMVLPQLLPHYSQPVVYQIESARSNVENRLADRAASGDVIANRLELYESEVAAGRQHAKRVFQNENMKDLVAAVTLSLKEDFSMYLKVVE